VKVECHRAWLRTERFEIQTNVPVVMVYKQPKRGIQLVSRARAAVSAVMSGMGTTSDQQVKRSTAVRQYVLPVDVGRSPTRSMCS
jgi:hypothetical protein